MKLDIVVPYFKPDFLERTLESLQSQTNQNFKVFIFNDASPYDPQGIIDRFRKEIDLEFFQFENNLGSTSLAAHWNRCIEMLPEGGWVLILGDDDYLGEDCVENFYQNLEEIKKRNSKIVRFASAVIDTNNKVVSTIHEHPKIENSVEFMFDKFEGSKRSSLSEHIFRMDMAKKKKFKHFPLAWHSDDLALLEFSDFGDIFTINSSVVFVRFSDINISGRKDLSLLKNLASFQFYRYLSRFYSRWLTQTQREILLKKYEKCAINDKKNLSLFLKVSYTYFRELNFNNYLRFLNSYFRETFKILRTSSKRT